MTFAEDFKQDGFLAFDTAKTGSDWGGLVTSFYDLCVQINKESLKRLLEVTITADNAQQIVVSLSFARATQSFQAAILLANLGIETDAKTLVRSCLETGIVINGVAKDAAVIEEIWSDYVKHHSIFNEKLSGMTDAITGTHFEGVLNDYIERKSNEVNGFKGKWLDHAKLSERFGIKPIYDIAYRYISADSAHATVDSLKKFATYNDLGKLDGFGLRQNFDKIGETFQYASLSQLLALHAFNIVFRSEESKEFVSTCESLWAQLSGKVGLPKE
jgi:hypothetical protein